MASASIFAIDMNWSDTLMKKLKQKDESSVSITRMTCAINGTLHKKIA